MRYLISRRTGVAVTLGALLGLVPVGFHSAQAALPPTDLETAADEVLASDLEAEEAVRSLEAATVFAVDPQADICSRTPEQTQQFAYSRNARIAFENQGGLFDGGVCWWHSRLQRSSLYLATYRPDLPAPTRKQAIAIIQTLAKMDRAVTIPGYENFYQFSQAYEKEILQRLEKWQKTDGFLRFRWVDGLMGRWKVRPAKLKRIMRGLHQLIGVDHAISFEKLAFKGMIGSHAYLAIGSRANADGGYTLDVIDSNHPTQVMKVDYTPGQRTLSMPDSGTRFVPYIDFTRDLRKIRGALKSSCKK